MKKVLWMAEGMGLYTKGYSKKEDAVKAMRDEAQREYDCSPTMWGEYYSFAPSDITEESVALSRYFYHKSCEQETICDDNVCYECGETCGTNGRPTYAFIK